MGGEAETVSKLEDMSLEELWQIFPIFLTEQKAEWEQWYQEKEMQIAALFPGVIKRISHIGSTAVKGILAKPIIDILVEFSPGFSLNTAKKVFIQHGYRCMSEEDGRISLNSGYTEDGFAERVFHVHVRYAGDHDELYFRDYLNENSAIAKEYELLKCMLWRKYEHNRDAYTEGKTEFITKHTKQAKEQYKNRYG